MESDKHKLLKLSAKVWLRRRGCKDIREEVGFLNGKLIIDIVGYKDNKPVMGIECGKINNDSAIYKQLDFKVFSLPYDALYVDEVDEGRPYILLNGSISYPKGKKIPPPYKVWRKAFERERAIRREDFLQEIRNKDK